ncbi:hypothetical protein [Algibacter sp. L1A34]|uniref:hypothetical protein n=1 Tax=Algibacter sp. L1A34 TaxID=2686365 RepID=UPI00131A81F6|nr:hypothetical protein [Algibacter sp. L1A34]
MKSYLLLTYFVGLFLSFTECGGSSFLKKESKEMAINKQDTTITVLQHYRITVPDVYNIKFGEGDDTEFFEVSRPDQHLLISYEIGPGAKKKNITEYIEKANVKTIFIKTLNSNDLKFSYMNTGNNFRQLEGIVYLESRTDSLLTPLFDFSVKRELLKNTIIIFETLTIIKN